MNGRTVAFARVVVVTLDRIAAGDDRRSAASLGERIAGILRHLGILAHLTPAIVGQAVPGAMVRR